MSLVLMLHCSQCQPHYSDFNTAIPSANMMSSEYMGHFWLYCPAVPSTNAVPILVLIPCCSGTNSLPFMALVSHYSWC